MQISVIVPTYRRPELLKNCLTALLSQSFERSQYEIIVVSDGPDPATQQMVKELPLQGRKLRHILLLTNQGPAAARNIGWLSARSKVIAFTDDDTLPAHNWLSELTRYIDPTKMEAIKGKIIVPRSDKPTDYELNTTGLETAEFVTANCACTKLALIAVGGFDERFRMAWREDSDLHFKLVKQHIPIKYLETAVVVHPVRKPKWGVSIKEQKKTLFNALLYSKHPQLYRKSIQPKPPVLYYLIIVAFVVFVTGTFGNWKMLTEAGLFIWAMLTSYFIYKRLRKTSREAMHLTEMIITSIFIPFLSIYWQWYGAVKYRVLFI